MLADCWEVCREVVFFCLRRLGFGFGFFGFFGGRWRPRYVCAFVLRAVVFGVLGFALASALR